jgi:ferric-dicitrate binding protein FerR (iron transport regulator)
MQPAPPELPEPTVETRVPEPTQATRRIEPSPPGHGRRRLALGGALVAVAAIVVAAIALSGSGGGGDGDAATTPTTTKGEAPSKQPPSKPQPQLLSRSQLIGQADRICADSQDTYAAARSEFPAGEEEANVDYSRLLDGISSRAVRRFRALEPPPAQRQAYEEYLAAQERVRDYDAEALRAAQRGDTAAYLAAREKRDNESGQRYNLAREVGFEVCSLSP